MRAIDLQSMSLDELWQLRETVSSELARRLLADKRVLEKRLDQLTAPLVANAAGGKRHRRQYPKVPPKYRNPESPHQTWSGRGKQPRWVNGVLSTGKTLNDLRISEEAQTRPPSERRLANTPDDSENRPLTGAVLFAPCGLIPRDELVQRPLPRHQVWANVITAWAGVRGWIGVMWLPRRPRDNLGPNGSLQGFLL
jgi:DNA-binding protein H-NS